jgi:hypothetical protein
LVIFIVLGVLCVLLGAYLSTNKRAVFTIGSLVFLSVLFYLLVISVKGIGDRTFFYFVLAAILMRVALVIILRNSSVIREADSLIYHAEATRLSLALLGTGQLYGTTIAGQAYGYVYLTSFLYAGLGANPLIPAFINCLVGVFCGVYVYKIAAILWQDKKVALIASLLALFMPGILVWSIQNLKDSWVNLFVLIAVWRMVLVRRRGFKTADLLIVALCVGALMTIRFYLALIIAPLLIYAVGAGRKRSLIYLGVLLLIVMLIFSYVFIGRQIMGVRIGLEELSNRLTGLATGEGGSSTGQYRNISSPLGAIKFLPQGLVVLLFSPFPWKTPASTLYALAYPEMIFTYILWPFIILGLIRAIKKKLAGIDILIISTTSIILLSALLAGNVGTSYRARAPIMLLLFVFAAGGLRRAHQAESTRDIAGVDSASIERPGYLPARGTALKQVPAVLGRAFGPAGHSSPGSRSVGNLDISSGGGPCSALILRILNKAIGVRSIIFKSSHKDQLSMYQRSRAIRSGQLIADSP